MPETVSNILEDIDAYLGSDSGVAAKAAVDRDAEERAFEAAHEKMVGMGPGQRVEYEATAPATRSREPIPEGVSITGAARIGRRRAHEHIARAVVASDDEGAAAAEPKAKGKASGKASGKARRGTKRGTKRKSTFEDRSEDKSEDKSEDPKGKKKARTEEADLGVFDALPF